MKSRESEDGWVAIRLSVAFSHPGAPAPQRGTVLGLQKSPIEAGAVFCGCGLPQVPLVLPGTRPRAETVVLPYVRSNHLHVPGNVETQEMRVVAGCRVAARPDLSGVVAPCPLAAKRHGRDAPFRGRKWIVKEHARPCGHAQTSLRARNNPSGALTFRGENKTPNLKQTRQCPGRRVSCLFSNQVGARGGPAQGVAKILTMKGASEFQDFATFFESGAR